MMFASATVLPPKEYRREMERTHEDYRRSNGGWPADRFGDEATNWERVCRNALTSQKIYERADYGPLADIREVIAVRIAPWLRPGRRWDG